MNALTSALRGIADQCPREDDLSPSALSARIAETPGIDRVSMNILLTCAQEGLLPKRFLSGAGEAFRYKNQTADALLDLCGVEEAPAKAVAEALAQAFCDAETVFEAEKPAGIKLKSGVVSTQKPQEQPTPPVKTPASAPSEKKKGGLFGLFRKSGRD